MSRYPRQKLLTELIENSPHFDVVPFHRPTSDKGARSHLSLHETGKLELGVSATDRIWVDLQIDGELTDRGQTISRCDGLSGHGSLHLVDDLSVEGHTALEIELNVDGQPPLLCRMS